MESFYQAYQAYESQVEKGIFYPPARKAKSLFQKRLLAGVGVVLMRVGSNLKRRRAAPRKLGGVHVLGKLDR